MAWYRCTENSNLTKTTSATYGFTGGGCYIDFYPETVSSVTVTITSYTSGEVAFADGTTLTSLNATKTINVDSTTRIWIQKVGGGGYVFNGIVKIETTAK